MTMIPPDQAKNFSAPPARRIGLKWLAVTALAVLAASLVGIWLVQKYVLVREFAPVSLTPIEEKVLDEKIERVERMGELSAPAAPADAPPVPEPYVEDPAMRTLVFSEKEVNALIAKNTDLAKKVFIDLSDNMASAKLLLPLDPDFPILGGKTLRVTAGLGFDYSNGWPTIMLKGVSLWGVPLPNAWLGHIKNKDLVNAFGRKSGFWKSFADGIEHIEIKDKTLEIKLRE